MTYYHQYKLPVAILRLTAVVGPAGKGGGRSWYEFAKNLSEGKKVQIPHFSKEELCHYVDIRDVARMFIAAAEHPKSAGEIFNCTGPAPTTGMEFERIVKELVPGIEVECGFPWSMAQGGRIEFDMSKAAKLIDFKPIYYLADSIKSIKDWVDSGGLQEDDAEHKKFGDGVKK
jgi:nucleoside-diphosphate-sugar epimerase